jgi:hypothetical protein
LDEHRLPAPEGLVTPKRFLFLVPAVLATVVTLWPADAVAQRRIVRRGPATRVVMGIGVGYPIYARPAYAYPYFYDPFWWGAYDFQYRRYPYPYYYQPSAELRIQVTPRQAEVYIDGYLVGTVDDFDGVFQRLHVPLGEHEITIYSPGHRTIAERMLFRPYESYHIRNVMQPLAAGDANETRPAPAPRSVPGGVEGPPQREGPPPRGGERPAPRDRMPPDRDAPRRADQFGTLSLRVQPSDAEISIDGERWDTPGGERIMVQLSEGTHRVEVRKEGHRTYTTSVRVRSGETVTLNVSLPAGG